MLSEKDFEVMGNSFDKEVDLSLIDKYEETGERKYVDEWLQTPNATAMAVHLLRFTTSRSEMTRLVTATKAKGVLGGVYKPDLLTDVYIQMNTVARTYQRGKGASFKTYLFAYVPKLIARELGKEMDTMNYYHQPIYFDGEDGEEFGLIATEEYVEDFHAIERKETIETFFDMFTSEEDKYILKSLLEEKTYSEMARELGVSNQAVHQRKDRIFGRIKEEKSYAKDFIY